MAPMMIYAAAGQLHQMPNLQQDINWIPIDICSASIVHLALTSSSELSTSPDEHVFHLLNPHPITYEQYLHSLRQAGLNFQTVSPNEFLQTILNTKDLSNPLVRLSSFLEQAYSTKDKTNLSKFQTSQTVQKCPILDQSPKIDSNLIRLYLNYWTKLHILHQ